MKLVLGTLLAVFAVSATAQTYKVEKNVSISHGQTKDLKRILKRNVDLKKKNPETLRLNSVTLKIKKDSKDNRRGKLTLSVDGKAVSSKKIGNRTRFVTLSGRGKKGDWSLSFEPIHNGVSDGRLVINRMVFKVRGGGKGSAQNSDPRPGSRVKYVRCKSGFTNVTGVPCKVPGIGRRGKVTSISIVKDTLICVKGITYGITSDKKRIWTGGGCEGTFRVTIR